MWKDWAVQELLRELFKANLKLAIPSYDRKGFFAFKAGLLKGPHELVVFTPVLHDVRLAVSPGNSILQV